MNKTGKIITGVVIAVAVAAAVSGGVLYHNDQAEKARIADLQAKAASVDAEITAIGDIDLSDQDAIEKAEKDYAALSDEGKGYVTGYKTLTDARKAYDELAAADEQARTDAKATDELIQAIGTVKTESGDTINAARVSYDGLSDQAKSYVTAYDTLTAAEKSYQDAQTAKAEADKAAAEAAAKAEAQKSASTASSSSSKNKKNTSAGGSSKSSTENSKSGNTTGQNSSASTGNASNGQPSAENNAEMERLFGEGSHAGTQQEIDDYLNSLGN